MPTKLDRIHPDTLAGNPRATLASWLKYQPIVEAAHKLHPKPYTYTPTNRSASTVSSQLRDAIRGCLAFAYPCAISSPDLLRWWSEVVIKHDGDTVYIGPLQQVMDTVTGAGANVSSNTTSFHFDELTFEEVSAFSVLLSTNRLQGPVVIARPPDLSLLPDRPNVERVDRPDGSLVLL